MYDENDNFYKPDRGSAETPDHVFLSFNGDAHTSMTVSWRTCTEISDGYAEYREDGSDVKTRCNARFTRLESDIDISHFYWADMTGLKPDTRYYYTVGNSAHRSAEFSFTTEPENLTKFTFFVISDHQKSSPWPSPDYSFEADMINRMLESYPDCRFLLTAGDNCDNGQNEIQWNGMFAGLHGVTERLPYMMATGNHDNRGYICYLPEPVGKFYVDHTDFFDSQFEGSYPHNGPEGYTTENYSFDYGNVHFTVMGINAPEKVEPWAYDDIRRSNKAWKIGVYHFPIYPSMPEGQNDDAYPWLRKPIEQGRLDLLFAGHEHSFARTYPMLDDQMFDSPSQGVIHYALGSGGRNPRSHNCRKIWHSYFYPQSEPLAGMSVVEVDGSKMTITAYLEDGKIIDRLTIDKENDTLEPISLSPFYIRPKLSYKGAMLDLIAKDIHPRFIDGQWFVAFALVVQTIGGAVEKAEGKVKLSLYDVTAEFTDGSDIAETDKGPVTLSAKVFRGDRNQLYMSAADCAEIFGMKWQYAERNNFINFDHPSENFTLSEQP